MTTDFITAEDMGAAVESVARDLVRLQRVNGSAFLNLPMLYPDGSSVTVRVDRVAGGLRVSDNGFAYREAEDVGAIRSFGQSKKGVEEEFGVAIGGKTIFTDTTPAGLFEAVCDVAAASWQIAARVYSRITDDSEEELSEEIGERLKRLFPPNQVEANKELAGASSVSWPVSAIVSLGDHKTVFQAVGEHSNSINRSATAFHDLALLPKPPRLVAVVRDQRTLGARASLLTQANARIVERGFADELWKAAA